MSDTINRVEKVVEDWFDSHIRSGAVARATEVYNQLVAAKAKLISVLKEEFCEGESEISEAIQPAAEEPKEDGE
jgi:benzoyl-CoA reductase/2-hydroxyglutaryl-CoA dehydratase subunit BcrC/BadD/HgdB